MDKILIHVSDRKAGGERIYQNINRVGSYTFRAQVEYTAEQMYSNAFVCILNKNNDWTELAEYSVDQWYPTVQAASNDEAVLAVFSAICEYLLGVALESIGALPPTPAQEQ
jgi:hypothetical protein